MKALFLDRDGVINRDPGYLYEIEKFEFIPGIFKLCQAALKKRYQIFVITNQSGVGRGYFSLEQYQKLCDWMVEQFRNQAIPITKIYSCFAVPEADESIEKNISPKDPNRKPNPGMILEAIKEFGIDPKASIMIGDKVSDLMAAEKAGVKTRILFSEKTSTHPAITHSVERFEEIESYL